MAGKVCFHPVWWKCLSIIREIRPRSIPPRCGQDGNRHPRHNDVDVALSSKIVVVQDVSRNLFGIKSVSRGCLNPGSDWTRMLPGFQPFLRNAVAYPSSWVQLTRPARNLRSCRKHLRLACRAALSVTSFSIISRCVHEGDAGLEREAGYMSARCLPHRFNLPRNERRHTCVYQAETRSKSTDLGPSHDAY